ncbi:beta-1,4-mannosyl-glycoprotein beta-1,4-N-acetylglucosaminyltransferase [Dendrobium catenatum]|uniref:Beta-1,4-mannosyl-glycoprotein beta-1,4-N-acetylglucosaminyltransferase n=1 Tax=Dendrobium catenatum TaxID=906689 RepID=A0A2I0VGI4_9ASPA|nr:beta-1,4-mannosyl-glycoprotein beta-1,4-N-acetylglucosaminyltransferase [Dendrobium catenatum]PKU72639.1 beta-1,4-mannosyl-glycoprotein beta-1,4-N-acetylglucosaminyltransferase [Dendrobium catenatum]
MNSLIFLSGITDDDLLIMSDADEIPSPETIDLSPERRSRSWRRLQDTYSLRQRRRGGDVALRLQVVCLAGKGAGSFGDCC